MSDVSNWSGLPAHLIEDVLRELIRGSPDRDTSLSDLFAACGTCTVWRKLGLQEYFEQPWDACPRIIHPLQLFSLSPQAVEGGLLQCYITRERPRALAVLGTSCFRLYLGAGGTTGEAPDAKFLLAALQGSRLLAPLGVSDSTTSIYLDKECMSEPVARLKSSWDRTRYSLAPTRHCVASQAVLQARQQASLSLAGAAAALEPGQGDSMHRRVAPVPDDLPQTLAVVEYSKRVQGFMRPRMLTIRLPNPADLACFENKLSTATKLGSAMCADGPGSSAQECTTTAFRKLATSGGLRRLSFLQSVRNRSKTVAGDVASAHSSSLDLAAHDPTVQLMEQPKLRPALVLKNKLPRWNAGLRCWCLNFRSRVKMASVKNFQLQCCDLEMADALAAAAAPAPSDEPPAQPMTPERRLRKVTMQFGKASNDEYIMDYDPTVLTAVQAFGIALSTFDGKLRL